MFERMKKWYKQGLWTEEMVQTAADKGILTKEEAAGILGKEV
jgi:hypothetical protein